MKKIMQNISTEIVDRWMMVCERGKRNPFFHRMEKELGSLNPGISLKMLIRNYYIEKIQTGLIVMMIFIILIVFCICNAMINGDLEEGRYLKKEEVGEGKKEVTLQAKIGKMKINDLLIEVDEKELSDEEIRQYLYTVGEQLPNTILGKNETLYNVREPLILVNTWEDTGISIFWSSSNCEVLQEDGVLLSEKIPEEGIEVTLTALLSWKDYQIQKVIPITVYPKKKTKEEQVRTELLNLVKIQRANTEEEEYIVLPEMLEHTPIIWKEEKMDTAFVMLSLMIVTILAIMWGKDQDIHKQYEIRNRQLLLEYSEFVSKLQLLISSGTSTRGAFLRLAKDYIKRKKQGGDKKYVYEELLVAVRKMESGMNEIEAYYYFAKRCDLICYKKLAAIITQNVKRGTDGLRDSLSVEIRNAFEIRKQEVRKLGEEAGTKLLIPMMMMMGIVLIIIVIPAYFSFGGI